MPVIMKPLKTKATYSKVKEAYVIEFKDKENWLLIFGKYTGGDFSAVISESVTFNEEVCFVYSLEMQEAVIDCRDSEYHVIFGEYKGEIFYIIPNRNLIGRLSNDLDDVSENTKILSKHFDNDTAEIVAMSIAAA